MRPTPGEASPPSVASPSFAIGTSTMRRQRASGSASSAAPRSASGSTDPAHEATYVPPPRTQSAIASAPASPSGASSPAMAIAPPPGTMSASSSDRRPAAMSSARTGRTSAPADAASARWCQGAPPLP